MFAWDLYPSVGETGFQRALELQLNAQYMEESGGKPNFHFCICHVLGCIAVKKRQPPASPIDQFTLAMTDDGAPIESNFVEILDLRAFHLTGQ